MTKGLCFSPWAAILLGLTFATPLSALAVEPPSPPTYGVHMENTWIPMKDSIRLSVTLYMPDGGKAGEKFPAVLEYHPYRKDDATASRDYPIYSYFARRGYVCARVDIRGFGTSEGVPTDREYSEQEQLDGLQIIAWLAHQPWSNGNVGMMGISWSGFNSLQMAMRHAPELKAIIKGKAETNYPWGKETDYESLVYNVDDAHPETSSVHGEAESIFVLKGRELRWRGHLSVATDQKNFYYRYTRELLKDSQMVKQKTWQETIPRDHQ